MLAIATVSETPRTVLLVEDDELSARIFVRALQSARYPSVRARTAYEALEHLTRQPDEVMLIVLDLRLPGMSGLDFLEVRRRNPKLAAIPVVVVSGDAELVSVGAADVDASFEKPLPLRSFVESLRAYERA